MKTTVLKASRSLAEQIANDLLSIPSKVNPERTVFIRIETERGFRIQNRNINAPILALEYTDQPAPRIDYNQDIISL